jgi:hypothetical protein
MERKTFEKLTVLYSSPNIIRVIKSRKMRWTGHVTRMEEGRGAYRILVGRPEGRRPLERPRRRWEDNITMDIFTVRQNVQFNHIKCAITLSYMFRTLNLGSSSGTHYTPFTPTGTIVYMNSLQLCMYVVQN